MANTTHTVITTGGGNYLTLNAYEDAIDGTAYGAGETATVNCSGTAADTTAVTFAGWDADVTVIVNGDYAVTSGVHWSDSYYHLTTANHSINVNDILNIKLIKLQFAVSTAYDCCVNISEDTPNVIIDRCIGTASTPADSQNGVFCVQSAISGSVTITNSIFYGFSSTNSVGIYIRGAASSSPVAYVYNCTIVGNTIGIYSRGTVTTTTNVINCAVFNNGNDLNVFGEGVIILTYSAGDDAEFDSGTGNIGWDDQSTTWDDHFPNYATYDFHLAASSSLINAGTDLYGSGVTTDIDGDTLSVRNDIGADEYVAAGGGEVTPYGYLSTNKGFW